MDRAEFAPDENITREQITAIMYRYAKYKGYDISVGEDTNILSYTMRKAFWSMRSLLYSTR